MTTDALQRLLLLSPAERRAVLGRLGRSEREQPRPAPDPLVRTVSWPAAPSQVSQWYLWNLAPDSDAYHVSWTYDLRGPLNRKALDAALAGLLARHESLRTRYSQQGGTVMVHVAAPAPVALKAEQVTGTDSAAGRQAALGFADAAARLPFDLRSGPLYRMGLWRYGPERHLLMMSFHHSIVDEWSRHVMERDLGVLYGGELGLAADLPPSGQYREAVPVLTELAGRELPFWVERLSGCRPSTIPYDHDTTTSRRRPVARESVVLPSGVSAAIGRIAGEAGTTRFAVVLALCWLFLARQSGAADIALGSPVTAREGAGTAETVGFFLNTLVLRGRVFADSSFRALVEQAHTAVAEAMAHQHCPLDEVVRALGPSGAPLFTTLFSYLRAQPDTPCGLELPGLHVSTEPILSEDAQADLAVTVFDKSDRVTIVLDRATDRYTRASAAAWGRAWLWLASRVVADVDAPLGSLLAAAPGELDRRPPHPAAPLRRTDPVHGLPLGSGSSLLESPDAPAVIEHGASISRGELHRAASALAGRLAERGVGRGDRVALELPVGSAAVAAVQAVWRLSATVVPAVPGSSPTGVRCVVGAAGADRGHDHLQVSLDPRRWDGPVRPLPPVEASCPGVPSWLAVPAGASGTSTAAWICYEQLQYRIQFLMEHHARARRRLGRALRVALGAEPTAPLFLHQVLVPAVGDVLVLARPPGRFDAESYLRLLREQEIDALYCTTAQAEALATAGMLRDGGAPALLLLHGRAASRQFREELRNRPDTEVYRTTGYDGAPAVVGPLLESRPLGVSGELVRIGVGVGAGIPDHPGATAAVFVPDPLSPLPGARLHRSGRAGRLRADGRMEEFDPAPAAEAVGPERSEAVEAAFRDLPGVAQVAVVPAGADPMTVHLVCEEGFRPTEAALRSAIGRRLPAREQVRFLRLPQLPLTQAGEVDLEALARIQVRIPARKGPRSHPNERHSDA